MPFKLHQRFEVNSVVELFESHFQVKKLQVEIDDENQTQAEISSALKRIGDSERRSKLQISLVSIKFAILDADTTPYQISLSASFTIY